MKENTWCPLIEDCCKGKICVCYDGADYSGGDAFCCFFETYIPDQEPGPVIYPQGVE